MTDLVEKARLGRTNALNHIAGGSRADFTSSRGGTERRFVPVAFVSSRGKMGGHSVLI